jgi:hypothetical protein
LDRPVRFHIASGVGGSIEIFDPPVVVLATLRKRTEPRP